jgi:hypothetical protein
VGEDGADGEDLNLAGVGVAAQIQACAGLLGFAVDLGGMGKEDDKIVSGNVFERFFQVVTLKVMRVVEADDPEPLSRTDGSRRMKRASASL